MNYQSLINKSMKLLPVFILALLPAYPLLSQACCLPDRTDETCGRYASYDCVNLLDSTSVSVNENGSGTFAVRKVIKIQTPAGALRNRVIVYDYDPLTAFAEFKQATVYKANGEVRTLDVKKACDYAAPARAIYWGARQVMLEA